LYFSDRDVVSSCIGGNIGTTEGARPFVPGEEKTQEGLHHSIPVLKRQIQRGQALHK